MSVALEASTETWARLQFGDDDAVGGRDRSGVALRLSQQHRLPERQNPRKLLCLGFDNQQTKVLKFSSGTSVEQRQTETLIHLHHTNAAPASLLSRCKSVKHPHAR